MSEMQLTLHPDKTHIVDMRNLGATFEFLGYLFKNHKGRLLRYPRSKSISKMKDKIRTITPRLSGQSMNVIIERTNRTLVGWFEYYKHSSSSAFGAHDSWIRSRLRSILRRRKSGSRNRYGKAHTLWPNSYFNVLGLFNLETAHRLLRVQSA